MRARKRPVCPPPVRKCTNDNRRITAAPPKNMPKTVSVALLEIENLKSDFLHLLTPIMVAEMRWRCKM